eukprot:TRINITY_DN19943_c0_g1_i1.p1 TRINITY_DN19943_c0_g1~~TRINITY_DN19943_c0_g1_i1.p1  ORF type:complete len:221 (-),score=12.76 TRINITY_DN19943_c0_g1_i1:24-686(-)
MVGLVGTTNCSKRVHQQSMAYVSDSALSKWPRPSRAPRLNAPAHTSDNLEGKEEPPNSKWQHSLRDSGSVRMLKGTELWQIGDVFDIICVKGDNFHLRRISSASGKEGTISVRLSSEGIQWEYASSNGNNTTLGKDSGSSRKRKKRDRDPRDNPDPGLIEQYLGQKVRMLKTAKMWQRGDVYTITARRGDSWQIGAGGLTIARVLEGTQWELLAPGQCFE